MRSSVGRRQAELAAEAPQELGRAPQSRGKLLVGLRRACWLRKEERQGERELSAGHAARDVLERDPRLLERGHEANHVDIGRREEPVLVVPLEDAELLQPAYLLERAGDELGELLRRDLGHGGTLAFSRSGQGACTRST